MSDSYRITPIASSGTGSRPIVSPRSWLFVPATYPERFNKALNSGAEAVIIDLEDAVALDQKRQARENIAEFFSQLESDNVRASVWLRLNNDEQLAEDLVLCKQLTSSKLVSGVLLPKLTSSASVTQVWEQTGLTVVGQIESALGLSQLNQITQSKGLMALSYGRLDISNELSLRAGSQAEQDFFRQLRVTLLLASKANGLQAPIESIYADFKDEAGMQMAAEYASDLGFSGMLCIHPKQVALVNTAFTPSQAQLEFAQQVIDYYQRTGESIFAIDGVMVDLPVILQCQTLLSA
ncbi:CoA ester lyase [Psychrobacter sp. YP14]|uniref:HpcH/HpaI aldolase/citrate lyase family protein n=1 Tax=Psychrobacter sp. YP14 TaxID=2203895 RepID=UPI000D7D3017|nr:CoA ester lyase [Psychrobacter sp. YP14]AWT48535.1 CoA ester lyase [Psychrobacter sp. YP14]